MQFNQYYFMEEADDCVTLFEKRDHKYRANQEARDLGNIGRRRELKLRRLTTQQYCNDVGKSYENVLRFNL